LPDLRRLLRQFPRIVLLGRGGRCARRYSPGTSYRKNFAAVALHEGNSQKPVRCVALKGEVGKQVTCSIYSQRPSPCREFDVFEEDGSANPRCAALRAQLPQA